MGGKNESWREKKKLEAGRHGFGNSKNQKLNDNPTHLAPESGSDRVPKIGILERTKKELEESGNRSGGRTREEVESRAPAGQTKTYHSWTIISEK